MSNKNSVKKNYTGGGGLTAILCQLAMSDVLSHPLNFDFLNKTWSFLKFLRVIKISHT